jgi:hypothetical protein
MKRELHQLMAIEIKDNLIYERIKFLKAEIKKTAPKKSSEDNKENK